MSHVIQQSPVIWISENESTTCGTCSFNTNVSEAEIWCDNYEQWTDPNGVCDKWEPDGA